MEWFLYDREHRHERVKNTVLIWAYFKFYKFLKFLSRAGCLIITKTPQKYFSSNSLFLKNRLVSRKCQPNETTELDVLCKKI